MTKWLLIALLAPASAGQAQDFRLESAGARFGFSTKQRTHTFNQAEGFADFNLPWRLDLGSDWRLQTRLDLSAGWLGAGNDDALVASLGPSLVLGHGHFPLRLDLGFSPTVISSHEFGSVDLGTAAQFTSHAGLDWDIGKGLRFGYRFQHMSNGGLSKHNPGLNLQMFALSYVF